MTTDADAELAAAPDEEQLRAYLRQLDIDERAPIPSRAAAELERLGWVMHGWGGTHVLTAAGRAEISRGP